MDAGNIIHGFRARAKANPKRIVFPEGENNLVIEAAADLARGGMAFPVLLGREEEIRSNAPSGKAGDLAGVEIISPADSPAAGRYAGIYAENRKFSDKMAAHIVRKNILFGGMMVSAGDADGMVAGISYPTALVLKAAGLTVGFERGVSGPSGIFIMELARPGECRVLVFADAAVNVNPSSVQLAETAALAGRKARELLGFEPMVALLSFSTWGSASHQAVEKVSEAAVLARKMAPGMKIDGELQADAAIVKRVARRKVEEADGVAGNANVLIFPDLNSANIAYKITQYLAGAKACGPLLQGFAKPVNDLSRGALTEDIIAVAAATVIEAGMKQRPEGNAGA